MKNAQEEEKEDNLDSSDNESPEKKKIMVSQNSMMFSPGKHEEDESADSLEKSFHETELASDDEEAER